MIDWSRRAPTLGLEVRGILERTRGPLIRVRLPGAVMEGRVFIEPEGPEGRVVALEEGSAWVLPLGRAKGLQARARVRKLEGADTIPDPDLALGRMVDGLGRGIDSGRTLPRHPRPNPSGVMARRKVEARWPTRIRVLDALLPLGIGQRVGLFSGPGVGKSSLLARLAQAPGHEVLIAALVGERSREVGAFMDGLGSMRDRSTVVVATADESPMLRLEAAWTASHLAAAHRAQGRSVLLLVDSLTRFARATRELGSALGEAPCIRGFPARSFSELASLVELGGAVAGGAVTAIHTVLEEDEDDPIAEEIKSLLDGHLVLDPERARRDQHPAIDVLASVSRCAQDLMMPGQAQQAAQVRAWLALLARDDVRLGLVGVGQDPAVDEARSNAARIEAFLAESAHATDASESLAALGRLVEA